MPTDAERRHGVVVALEIIRRQQVACEISDEQAHRDADAILIAYINDPDVTRAFEGIDWWYA